MRDFREELAVPKTFRDYNRVASFFTRGCNAASPHSTVQR